MNPAPPVTRTRRGPPLTRSPYERDHGRSTLRGRARAPGANRDLGGDRRRLRSAGSSRDWSGGGGLPVPMTVGAGAAVLSRLLDLASLLLVALIPAPLAGVALHSTLLAAGLLPALLIAVGLTALFWSRPRKVITTWLEGLPLPARIHDQLHLAIEELGSGSRPALLVTATVAARVATS